MSPLTTTIRSVHQRMQRSIWLGENLFCKLDCSQAYHCLQMADQQSIDLLAFNFASPTFAYRRMAQGLCRSHRHFRASYANILIDPVIKTGQCAPYVADIGIAANTTQQLIKNLPAVFQCLKKAGRKLSMAKCHFGVQEVDLFGRTKTTKGLSPQNFLEKSNFHDPKKHFNDTSDFSITIETTYLDWQNDSLRFFNYSKLRTPKLNFRSLLTSSKYSGK